MADKEKLTPKQKTFAELYVKLGNATEAAKQAGYSQKTASVIGLENLKKPLISEYINQLATPGENQRIADAQEVMQYFSAVMRGEVKDQFGLDAPLQERTRAAQELAKRLCDSNGKPAQTAERGKLADAIKALPDIWENEDGTQ